MRWNVGALLVLGAVGVALGIKSPIPVSVTPQDLQKQVQTIQNATPHLDHEVALEHAVEILRGEQTRRVRSLFAAYVVLWTALGIYMITLSRRQTRLLKELERLRSQMKAENTPPLTEKEKKITIPFV